MPFVGVVFLIFYWIKEATWSVNSDSQINKTLSFFSGEERNAKGFEKEKENIKRKTAKQRSKNKVT